MDMSLYVTNDKHTEKVYDSFAEMFKDNHFRVDEEHDFFKHFLSEYEQSCLEMTTEKVFLRGRINGKEAYEDKDLFAPPQDKANAGRLNPKGISFLYVAEEEKTVVSELRPWIGAEITIATCEVLRELKLISLVPNSSDADTLNSFRRVISAKFSKPIAPHEKELSYVPTQYIAEYFKRRGYDGIKYSSATHEEGINYVFFNPNKDFKVKIRNQIKVNSINFDFNSI
ncbi:RES family NAD+ phosphorylase [Paenibacillus sp. SYP-B3998]|uniref:RES family NAD+ phosphorylase n=1 Tax=Paenibacillus sp. SYP-B3998 TaxID=2678564 RepID=A0A6G3ZV42_9BACL|nr:RES family NAD+ phosphorylase [Paenibacillus sp. SYP-B3998]NEW05940.1 RES family NAD+ phosphorylase [Paenibacillus sp. SYP-B3998]